MNIKHIHRSYYFVIISFFILIFLPSHTFAADETCGGDYLASPPFLNQAVKANVMFMMDNSGSMKNPMYKGGNAYSSSQCSSYDDDFNPNSTYYGMFDSSKKYEYDMNIEVDTCNYGTSNVDSDGNTCTDTDAPYDITVYNSKGAFVEDSCTPGTGVNCWDGNFLNWLVTRRADAARQVMIGGKVENREGYDYLNTGDLQWKLLGNNEPEDRYLCRVDDRNDTDKYTPFPSNTQFQVESPAHAGSIKTTYEPYAKIVTRNSTVNTVILDINGDIIGEFGLIEDVDHTGISVTLSNTYSSPVIIISPSDNDGADPAFARISDITSNSFNVFISEWKTNKTHTTENLFYVVMKPGLHILPGDLQIYAGTTLEESLNTNSTQSYKYSDYYPKSDPSGDYFTNEPVVVVTNEFVSGNSETINSRITSLDENRVNLAYDHFSPGSPDAKVKTHIVAIDIGSSNGSTVNIISDVATGYSQTQKELDLGQSATSFVASLQDTANGDTDWLRHDGFSNTFTNIFVQNGTGGSDNEIGFISFAPATFFNVAVVVTEEPQGLLHDIENNVRLGFSVYRYEKDSNIYSTAAHGGTMIANLPLNPFIKDGRATANSYRVVNTPIKADIGSIIDVIEHYPLIWGTTPLAENLYEVGNYFKQIDPYYSDKPTEAGDTYLVNDTWDPYVYDINGSSQKVKCAKSYTLLFTDGEPYTDVYVPKDTSGDYTGIGNYDRDSDNEATYFSTESTTNKSYKGMLDDVAAYLNSERPSASGDPLVNGSQDLRDDIDNNQYIKTYTVAFGTDNPPQALLDTAANGDGKSYAATSGAELLESLSEAFSAILDDASAGSSVSVLSEKATTGSLVTQALFFPTKKFNTKYDVEWTGSINGYWFYTTPYTSNIRDDYYTLGSAYPALDIYEDRILDFKVDTDGALTIDYYNAISNTGQSDDGSSGDTAAGTYSSISEVPSIEELKIGEVLRDRVTSRNIFGAYSSTSMASFTEANSTTFQDLFNLTNNDLDSIDIVDCLGTGESANKPQAAKNLINYTRGLSDDFTSQSNIDNSCRSRQVDDAGKKWKLGDIIYSTPQTVKYELTSDEYSVLYTGANDGMLHAFKIGALRKDKAGTNQSVVLCESGTDPGCNTNSLGEELWSFIPRNAMPYLKYLANPEYQHIYTVDLTPYIIKHGDKTILIGGMRFGGATGCTDKNGDWCSEDTVNYGGESIIDNALEQVVPPNSNASSIADDTLGLSSYFALDITDPENPVFLWEFTDQKLGYSYSGPGYISRKDGDAPYILFTSGPLNARGDIVSGQDLRMFILELDKDDFTLDQVHKIDSSGKDTGFVKGMDGSFDKTFGNRLFNSGVDLDDDGNTDALFFGANEKDGDNWKGGIYVLAPNDDPPTSAGKFNWIFETIGNVEGAITAQVVHGDCFGYNYLYFGTGRWFYKFDTPGQNSNDTNNLWGVQVDSCLQDIVDGEKNPKCGINMSGQSQVGDAVCSDTDAGKETLWNTKDLDPATDEYSKERVISDPSFYENISFFTSMQPSSDVCGFGGRTRTWALNCRSGHSIFDDDQCDGYTVETPLPGALLLQLSGGNIEDIMLTEEMFNQNDGRTTDWYQGAPPESASPFVPYSGTLNGEIILWLER